MDDQKYFLMCLLDSMDAAGFAIDRQREIAQGSAAFATLHPDAPVRIAFKAYFEGVQFHIEFGTLWIQKSFPYRRLMKYPPKVHIVIPEVFREIFKDIGDELAANFQQTILK